MTTKNRQAASPTALDTHIGQRLRMQRELANLTQDALARKIGISAQQIQKYETGDNRISAARLYDFSNLLGVPLDYFFIDARATKAARETSSLSADSAIRFATTPEGIRLLKAYGEIQEPTVRLKFIELFEQMAKKRT